MNDKIKFAMEIWIHSGEPASIVVFNVTGERVPMELISRISNDDGQTSPSALEGYLETFEDLEREWPYSVIVTAEYDGPTLAVQAYWLLTLETATKLPPTVAPVAEMQCSWRWL